MVISGPNLEESEVLNLIRLPYPLRGGRSMMYFDTLVSIL
jgi:hypothetical protein